MKMTDKIIMATVVVLSGLAVNSLRGQSASSWKIPQWQFDGTNYTWRPTGTETALQALAEGSATNASLLIYSGTNLVGSVNLDTGDFGWDGTTLTVTKNDSLLIYSGTNLVGNVILDTGDFGWDGTNLTVLGIDVVGNLAHLSTNQATANGWVWSSDGTNITITAYDHTLGGVHVTIPDTIGGLPVTEIAAGSTPPGEPGDGAFDGNSALKSIDGGGNLIVLSDWVFLLCDGVERLSLNAAESIGLGTFARMYALTDARLPAVTTVGEQAFFASTNALKIYWGAAVPTFGADVFFAADGATNFYPAGATDWLDLDPQELGGRPAVMVPAHATTLSSVALGRKTLDEIFAITNGLLTEADADALYLSITNNFLPASTITNLLDAKVSTNDTRKLDLTGADIRIADSLHIDSPTTRKDLFDAIQEFAQTVFYGTTNAHPVLAGYGTLVDLDDMPSQQTVDVALPGNTYVEVGRFAYTNATDFIRATKSFGSFWMSKATPNRSVSAQMSTAYTNVVTGANGIFDTSAFEPIPDTFLNSYRLSISPTFSVDDPETNTYYTVIFGMTNNVLQATTVTLYLGDPYDTHIEFGGLGKPEGFVTQADLDAADAAIYATVATNYVKITDGVATNLTVDGTLTVDGDVTASGTVETDTGYLFDSVNALRLYKGSLAFYGSVAIGEQAGDATTGSGADRQTAIGYLAGSLNSGANQTALGYFAGRQNSGANQTALGYLAGLLNTGANQTAMGYEAGRQNTGANQAALGYFAGRQNSGANQTAIGYAAGRFNSGANQTAMGYAAGYQNSGINQTTMGYEAGRFIGPSGTTANTNSANATYLGANTRSLTANDDNIIVVGSGAIGKGSGTAVWGQSAIEENYFSGAINFTQVAATPSTIAGSGWIYAKTNEVYVLDGTGNETLIGPHAGTDQWSFISRNRYTGREISVDMEGMVRALERVSGDKLMQVSWREPSQVWGADEAAKVARRDADIAAWDAEAERRQFEEPEKGEPELGPMGERPQPYTPKPVPKWITERLKQRPGARQ